MSLILRFVRSPFYNTKYLKYQKESKSFFDFILRIIFSLQWNFFVENYVLKKHKDSVIELDLIKGEIFFAQYIIQSG